VETSFEPIHVATGSVGTPMASTRHAAGAHAVETSLEPMCANAGSALLPTASPPTQFFTSPRVSVSSSPMRSGNVTSYFVEQK
jgi:hypothetical protein